MKFWKKLVAVSKGMGIRKGLKVALEEYKKWTQAVDEIEGEMKDK